MTFNQATNGTYAGVMSGTGNLNLSGTGTVTLSGANTYSGGTMVSAGSLTGTTTSLQGAIVDNANVTFNQATNGTYAGVLSGTGTLTKSGAGTVSLSGANTYSGGTTVSAGILQGDTTSLQGNLVDNANVTFNQSTNGTYAGVLSGTGSLTKNGTGTVTLSGANTYSGGTTVSAGSLQGDTTSLQGNIVDNGNVTFSQIFDGTYAGNISGTGSLTLSGTGTVSLTGNNTYTGGIVLSSGTLQGNTTSIKGNIVNDASVIFDQSFNGTYAGNMNGTGDVSLNGTGTVIFSGANTYSGGTTVSAGSLTGTTTSLQGDIVNNANVTFNQLSNGTYAGVMSGSGSLTLAGSGTVTSPAPILISGGTTVSAGILQGDTTSLQGNLVDNGNVTFNQMFNGTYAGNISGAGSLTKDGAGTVILSGANTYSGGTTVFAGSLQGDTTSLQGNIINNGNVTFSQMFSGTYAGNISGTGSSL